MVTSFLSAAETDRDGLKKKEKKGGEAYEVGVLCLDIDVRCLGSACLPVLVEGRVSGAGDLGA